MNFSAAASPPNLEDYSATATVIEFDRGIPLLRGSIPAGTNDDPDSGPYVLAFDSPSSWSAAYKKCETLIKEHCLEGARIGCAITASKNCKPPWWRRGGPVDLKERERCEEREMDGCLAAATEKCDGFARAKCLEPFMEARIRVRGNVVKGMVWMASMPDEWRLRDLIGVDQLGDRFLGEDGVSVTNYRARDLVRLEKKP